MEGPKTGDVVQMKGFTSFHSNLRVSWKAIKGRYSTFMLLGAWPENEPLNRAKLTQIMNALGWYTADQMEAEAKRIATESHKRQPRKKRGKA